MKKTLLSILILIILSGCSIEDIFSHQTTQYIALRERKMKGSYNVEKARQDGVTEREIAEYLAKTRNYRLDNAIKAGVPYKEIIDYLAKQPGLGQEWKLHKIMCKIYPEKQDIIYWVEAKESKERSPLYKMKNCIVAGSGNWQGEMDYGSWPWPTRVEVVKGRLKLDHLELPIVGWWKWNFNKKNFQNSVIISTTWFVWNNILVWILLGIGILLAILYGWYSDIEEKKRKRQEAEQVERKQEGENNST